MTLNLSLNASEVEPARGPVGSSKSTEGGRAGDAVLSFALLLAADEPESLIEAAEIPGGDGLDANPAALAASGNALPPGGGVSPLLAGGPAGLPAAKAPGATGAPADSIARFIGMVRAVHGWGGVAPGERPGVLAGETLFKPDLAGVELPESLRANLSTAPQSLPSGAMQSTVSPQASAPPPSLPISVAPGRPDWSEAVGQRVLWMVNSQTRFAELRLNPPELGPVEVRVRLEDDGLKLHFAAGNGAVREALETAAPRLREMLLAEGLRLDDLAVGQRQAGADPRTGGDRDGERGDGAAGGTDGDLEVGGLEDEGRQRLGLVDCFV